MSSNTARTYTITVRNNRGKVVEERDVVRNSQWSAHGAARNLFRDQPAGSHMTVSLGGKVIEEWAMHADGWTFEVKNGATVVEASRSLKKMVPSQRGSKPSTPSKATNGRKTKPARKASTKVIGTKARVAAKAPF